MKRLITLFLLCAFSTLAQSGTFIQATIGSNGNGSTVTDWYVPLPNPITNTGNSIICWGQYAATSVTLTVSDDKSDSFTVRSGANSNQVVFIAYKINLTAGAQVMQFHLSTARGFNKASCMEAYNITAFDVGPTSGSSWASTTTMTAGSATPTQTGDFVVAAFEQDSSGAVTSFTKGSQSNITWNLLDNDWGFGDSVDMMAEYGIYNSTSALNPNATVAPSSSGKGNTALFKSGSQGAASTQVPYTNMVVHYAMQNFATSQTVGMPIPAGDTMAVYDHICPSTHTTAVTDSKGNTWGIDGTVTSSGGQSVLGHITSASPTFSSDATLTATENLAGNACDITISGFTGTTTFDSSLGTAGFMSTSGTQGSSGNLATLTITPSVINEIFFIDTGVSSYQLRAVSGTPNYCYSSIVYSPSASSGPPQSFDENNGRALCYNGASTAAFTVTFTTSAAGGVGGWQTAAIGFKSTASSSIIRRKGAGVF